MGKPGVRLAIEVWKCNLGQEQFEKRQRSFKKRGGTGGWHGLVIKRELKRAGDRHGETQRGREGWSTQRSWVMWA